MTTGYRFSPSTLTIAVGDRVTAHNADTTGHTFTHSPTWDSGNVAPGASYTYRFTKAGTYDFVCSYHSGAGMTGTISVH